MANVIKHKRGSGSDPVANDLVVGEVAIRTDVGKLFTKMDNGSVAEIAGGGSDIAINTLSSSSGTGGGSATFNGSAFRFTLSAPPSVSAQQLLVSINGVIQKPVAGTGQPSEGFSVDGTDIILGAAPATGSDFFILTFKSLGVSEPADNSVTSAKIADGAIVNADINASAAIAGTKIDPDFGSQDVATTGNLTGGQFLNLSGTVPHINFLDSNDNPDYRIINRNGSFNIEDQSSNAIKLAIDSSGRVLIGQTSSNNSTSMLQLKRANNNTIRLANSDATATNFVALDLCPANSLIGARIVATADGTFSSSSAEDAHLKFFTTADGTSSERMRIDSSGNVGIGTTSPVTKFVVSNGGAEGLEFSHSSGTNELNSFNRSTSGRSPIGIVGQTFTVTTGNPSLNTGLFQNSSGNVGIGTTSPSTILHVKANTGDMLRLDRNNTGSVGNQIAFRHSNSGTLQETGSINCVSTANAGAGQLRFHTKTSGGSNTEKMRIENDGKVGIGTTSPSTILHVKTFNPDIFLENTGSGTGQLRLGHFTNGAFIGTYNDDGGGSDILRFGTHSGDERMRIDSSGYVGIGTSNPLNLIHTSAANDASGIRMTNTFDSPDNVWAVLPSISGVSNTGFTIRDVTDGRNCLVIDGIGRVSIGTSSTNSRLLVETTANTMVPMAVNDSSNTSTLTHRIAIRTNGTEVGSIKSTNSATQYNTSGSDRTLKKNFESWNEDVLSLFKNINPQKFNFIQEEDGANKSKGFIAQEIANSFPEAYTKGEGENDKYWFNPSGMVVYLMKALQEAVARIEVLEAK